MRYRRYKHHCCEDFDSVDIRKLHAGSHWQYPAPGIAVQYAESYFRFVHDNLDYIVRVERTWCNYGGSRPWFLCPSCGDRHAVLYRPPDCESLGCRRCLKLLYLSECEDPFGRAILKVRKLERTTCVVTTRLVGASPVADKPKGQHWLTYDRRIARLIASRQSLIGIWKAAQQAS